MLSHIYIQYKCNCIVIFSEEFHKIVIIYKLVAITVEIHFILYVVNGIHNNNPRILT